MKLTDDITSLKGIGPKKADLLRDHGIETLADMLNCFPAGYQDRRQVSEIASLKPGKDYLIMVRVNSRRYSGNPYHRNTPVTFLASDDSGAIEIVYFNGRYMANALKIGGIYSLYGRISENRGRLQMIHPESHPAGDPEDLRAVLPVYPRLNGFSQKEFRRSVRTILKETEDLTEWLPEEIITEYRLAGPDFAYRNIHFPDNPESVLMSRFRFVFEELLTLETGLMFIRSGIRTEGGVSIDPAGAEEFLRQLPFSLTEGQVRVWREMSGDLKSDRAMNRLIQGDVGSGKTVIAEIAMFAAVRSGYQAAMMAPTEILARQHYQSLSADFASYGIRTELLCSSLKASEKRAILQDLAEGRIDLLVGTHAIIQSQVQFARLGLVITDEQHRFGVEQRRRLSAKGDRPNICVMTATPIPRTLAVVLYGEMDISIIDTMPAGRKQIITRSSDNKGRNRVYSQVLREIERGHQAYIVAPLIEDSESIDARSAEELYLEMQEKFAGYPVGLIHGSLKQEEKEKIMEDFVSGLIRVLVSTVVIEVGINVPSATVMVIENSERFGLAQLHQLRGRVGRGSDQSYCYLILGTHSEIADQRAQILMNSSDGFRIAEEDLNLRGPGELFGTRQHGLPEMHISDIVRHADVLVKARDAATKILAEDPDLCGAENGLLRQRVQRMFGEDITLEL